MWTLVFGVLGALSLLLAWAAFALQDQVAE
jgi:hypothetical protein